MLHAVIMAGGSGTRFWPQSRAQRPKQFLPLLGERTMLQETVGRVADWIPAERTWIVTNAASVEMAARQVAALPRGNFLAEPCGRNTAPCVGLAALQIAAVDPQGVMLVMPADHLIRPAAVFRRAIEQAVGIVERDPQSLVLFGVAPTYPSVGFGYIERGEALAGATPGSHCVASFREKPDLATAEEFLAARRFFWNAGIFVWRASSILEQIERFEPALFAGLERLKGTVGTAGWEQALAAEFPRLPSISIDYAVLERAGSVCMVEAPFEWDDVGSWEALARLRGVDENQNTIDGLHVGVDTAGCIVRSGGDHLVATIGISDCIVVHTPDATLVARKGDEAGLRKLIAALRERGHERFL